MVRSVKNKTKKERKKNKTNKLTPLTNSMSRYVIKNKENTAIEKENVHQRTKYITILCSVASRNMDFEREK